MTPIYLEHDNPCTLRIKTNRKRKDVFAAEDLSQVTRAVVRLDKVEPAVDDHEQALIDSGDLVPTEPIVLDSDILGEGQDLPFNWTAQPERGVITFLFGGQAIPEGLYEMRLVVYGSFAGLGVPNGFVVMDGWPIEVRATTIPPVV